MFVPTFSLLFFAEGHLKACIWQLSKLFRHLYGLCICSQGLWHSFLVISPSVYFRYNSQERGRVAQSVTCLSTDASLTADPGVASSIPARSHTFVEIDYEIISTVILLSSAESFKIVVSYKRKYLHEVLVNCLFKLAQEKVQLGELTVLP